MTLGSCSQQKKEKKNILVSVITALKLIFHLCDYKQIIVNCIHLNLGFMTRNNCNVLLNMHYLPNFSCLNNQNFWNEKKHFNSISSNNNPRTIIPFLLNLSFILLLPWIVDKRSKLKQQLMFHVQQWAWSLSHHEVAYLIPTKSHYLKLGTYIQFFIKKYN